jgi:hypothetical protein
MVVLQTRTSRVCAPRRYAVSVWLMSASKAMNDHTSDAIDWLVTFTTRLRQTLPQGQYFISHAPIAPWYERLPVLVEMKSQYGVRFAPGGPYISVHQQVGDMIDVSDRGLSSC